MQILWLFLLLVLNFVISCANAYQAGRVWTEVRGWMRLVTWSALIMSACGFLSVTAVLCGFVAVAAHWIDHAGFEALLSLTYLMIIVPVLGTGAIITLHSWIEAWKRRDLGSIAVAGWNTYAQTSNTYDAANGGITSAWSAVSGFFGKDDDEDSPASKVAVLLVLLVAMTMAAGLTYVFFQKGRRAGLPVPYAAQRQAYG